MGYYSVIKELNKKKKKKSETMLFAATWIQPQIIILSEVRKINI